MKKMVFIALAISMFQGGLVLGTASDSNELTGTEETASQRLTQDSQPMEDALPGVPSSSGASSEETLFDSDAISKRVMNGLTRFRYEDDSGDESDSDGEGKVRLFELDDEFESDDEDEARGSAKRRGRPSEQYDGRPLKRRATPETIEILRGVASETNENQIYDEVNQLLLQEMVQGISEEVAGMSVK